MIPIIAIANFINGLIAGILAIRVYVRYRKRASESYPTTGVRYFIILYSCLTAMWLLYAAPGLFVTDTFNIMILQSLADVFVYVGAIIGVQISFFALNRRSAGTIVSIIMATAAVIYVFGRLFNHLPHIREEVLPYVYWRPDIPIWLPLLTGIVATLSSLFFVVTFLRLGYRARSNTLVFRRSLYLAIGMAFLFLASLAFFVLTATGLFFTMIMGASVLGIAGHLVMLNGIPYRDEHNQQVETYHASMQASAAERNAT